MTRTTHHISDTYMNAYRNELAADLTHAYRSGPALRRSRRTVGRLLVRFGANLFPETPEIVDGRIIVLRQPIDAEPLEKVA